MWSEDPFFDPEGDDYVRSSVSPAFRLAVLLPYDAGNAYVNVDAYEALFAPFRAVLEAHCDRIVMAVRPGRAAGRPRKIKTADWEPFRFMASVHDDPEDAMFTEFAFLDRKDPREGALGRGPAGFRYFNGPVVHVDATIPVADWLDHALDIRAVTDALQALPYISLLAGYGLSLSNVFHSSDSGQEFGKLRALADKYPALDMLENGYRAYVEYGDHTQFADVGIAGINWMTGVGEPFRSQAGPSLALDLPAGIRTDIGPHGTLFQLGDAPITGEAGVDDEGLYHYHTLGTRLAPTWMPDDGLARSPIFGKAYREESLSWEKRFYRPLGG